MPSRGKAVSKIKHSAIDALSASVEHLPALVKSMPEEASGMQVIERMYPRLRFLKEERNYNYSDLSDFLNDKLGLDLSPETVRSYMSLVKKGQVATKRKPVKGIPVKTAPIDLIADVVSIEAPPMVEPMVSVDPVPIEVKEPTIAPVIAPAIVEAPPSETAPKSPLRPGEWSHAELRKHFNKY